MGEDSAPLLTRVPLFAELSGSELERIAAVAIPRSFPKGVRVFHEGDHSDACYIVRSGDLRVTREHSDGRAIALATLGPGDIFGELAMLDGGSRSASVETLSDAELLALPASDVRRRDRRARGHRGEADRRDHPATAGDERARCAPVVSDGSEPRGRGARPADRRGGDPGGAQRDHRADDSGRPRPARRHVARERQPLPRHARAGGRSRGRAAAG